MNRKGIKKEEFDKFIDGTTINDYSNPQHYIQLLIRTSGDEVERCVKCPQEMDANSWIYYETRQFVEELNYFTYMHHDACTGYNYPNMNFVANGVPVSCLSAAHQQPKSVPAIDYFTQTIDQSTAMLLDQKNFPNGNPTQTGLQTIPVIMRRLYRILGFSFCCFNDIFTENEKKTHLCERFTMFCKLYKLMRDEDLFIHTDA